METLTDLVIEKTKKLCRWNENNILNFLIQW